MRDTDRDWQRIGEMEPFFGVLTDPRFRREALDPAAVEAFYTTGRHDIERVVSLVRRHLAHDFAPERALDFGCGVGRLTLAMRDYCRHVIGVDVSEAMIGEARKRQNSLSLEGVEWQSDLQVDAVEWVNTHIVLQHIPPDRGFPILYDLLGLLAHGGVATIHLTAWRSHERIGEIPASVPLRYDGRSFEYLGDMNDPPPGTMVMYDYDMTRVLAAFVHAGIHRMWLEHVDHDGHHGFQIIGQKQ